MNIKKSANTSLTIAMTDDEAAEFIRRTRGTTSHLSKYFKTWDGPPKWVCHLHIWVKEVDRWCDVRSDTWEEVIQELDHMIEADKRYWKA